MARKSGKFSFETSARALVQRLLRDYVRLHLGKVAVAVVCMLLVALATGAQARLLEPALDKVLVQGDATLAWLLPVVFLGVAMVKGFASYGQAVLMQKMGLRVIQTMQTQMFDRLIEADLRFIHGDATGKLISRFTNDVNLTRDALVKAFTGIGRDLLMVIVLCGVMVQTHWKMAAVALLVFPVSVFPILYIGRRLRRISGDTQQAVGQQTSYLDEIFKGFRQVKAYGMEDFERARAQTVFERLFYFHFKAGRTRSRSYPILETLGGVAAAAVLGWGGYLVIHGETTVGEFTAFFAAMLLAYHPIRSLANLNASLQEGLAAAERVFRMIDYQPAIVDAPDAKTLQVTEGVVSFAHVHFTYADDKPALHDITLTVPAGKTVALVGPSGAGKSTIFNLILRFYDVDQGTVAIDGQDIRSVTMASLRRSIGLVSQEVTLFNDSVRANILYGRPDATEERMIEAAKAAAAHDFIAALPQGYDTQIGERGLKLSGGQRQRLAIARAMLRDAPILLLDEATSALDSESERQIQSALHRLMQGRTTIVIAHRLSTVVRANMIYVLDHGRIVDYGSHQELMARKGLYARLSRMQFEDSMALGEPASRASLPLRA